LQNEIIKINLKGLQMTTSNKSVIDLMKLWQKIEDVAVTNTTEIIKNTSNPLIHVVMEIIRQDSAMHRRVQQIIIDYFEEASMNIGHDELEELWEKLKEHDDIEKKTIALAKEALQSTKSHLVKYLVEYLLTDEKKHDRLIEELGKLK